MFKLVDMLTLSATPIPRTLYLSLMGAKDMSTIETAPLNRIPTETLICPYDERIIRDAINRELSRQGQVYFLHNRVSSIETMRDKIAKLCPKARCVIGPSRPSLLPERRPSLISAFWMASRCARLGNFVSRGQAA